MGKGQKQEQKQHSQNHNKARIIRKKDNQVITDFFCKVDKVKQHNPSLPTPDKIQAEQNNYQAEQRKLKEKQLEQQKEELQLTLQNQKDSHERLMAKIRALTIREIKAKADLEKVLSKQKAKKSKDLQQIIQHRQLQLQEMKNLLTKDNQTQHRFQLHFLSKEIEHLEKDLTRLRIQHDEEKDKERLMEEEENCYFAKEGWPLLSKRYQTLKLIGKGGFSEVYEAYDLQNHRKVAIKLSDVEHLFAGNYKAEYIRHIRREYEVHKRLSHPNIVPLLQVLEVDSAICIVLEKCSGPTLAQLLRREGALPEKEAKMIVWQLLSVISYLSAQRVVHYDLKPANIIFHNGVAKVLDFGICKVIDNEHSKMALTSQGVGTYCYLPPETFSAVNPLLSNKVDIWSLGVIFYEMLFGGRPQFNEGILELPQRIGGQVVSKKCRGFLEGCLCSLEMRLQPFSAVRHLYFNDFREM